MNLFHLSIVVGVAALGLRMSFLLSHWGLLQAWYWRDFLEDTQISGPSSLTRRALFWAFVRERLEVWSASLRWGFSPVLSWRERVTIVRVQCCLLLVTIGWRAPIMVLGLDHCAQRRWSGWPSRQEHRWRTCLHQHLMTLVGDEAILKRVTLASLYPTVEDVPTRVAQHPELVQ